MNKIERDGKVAVLYSPGYGAGWSTWAGNADRELLCFDARLVQLVLDGKHVECFELAEKLCSSYYPGGTHNELEVTWVPKGVAFEINEYDGSESVHIIGDRTYMVA